LIAFQQTPEILQHHVPVVEKAGKIQVPSQNKKLSQIVPLLKSLFHSTLVLLPNLSSPPTTLLVLSQTEKLIPYITGFRKLIKQLIVAILDIWSRTVRTADEGEAKDQAKGEEQDAVKIAAFLWIRKVMVVGDPSLKELCLKVLTLRMHLTADFLCGVCQERADNDFSHSSPSEPAQKFALGALRLRSAGFLSTCLHIYSSIGNSSPQQYYH
jgi:hypothetical protein